MSYQSFTTNGWIYNGFSLATVEPERWMQFAFIGPGILGGQVKLTTHLHSGGASATHGRFLSEYV